MTLSKSPAFLPAASGQLWHSTRFLLGSALIASALTLASPLASAAEVELDSDAQKASYSIGYSMATNIRREFGTDMDLAAFEAGVRDQIAGTDSQLTEAEANAALQSLVLARQQAADAKATENSSMGKEFLAENGAREGVVTLPSGLQYEVLTDAEGPKPLPTDRVTTHYRGTLIDGTQFDSSYDRGQPATFPLNGVIAGWTEALQLMSPGAKWRLYIPPELAYGDRGQGPIPANSTLVFDVELISIN
ncbi:MAG: FKBP-type peptidyl-prolyl cis-trans isomerase [Pseudomonadota bacterium]